MRIFTAFLVLVVSAILWLLPIADGVYDFKTNVRADTFVYPTGVGVTTANVTLHKAIYDNDTHTIDLLSDTATDVPLFSAYNIPSRTLLLTGLSANTTRTLSVSYDVYALTGGGAIDTLVSRLDFIWMLAVISFPIAGLAAIFTSRAGV